MKAHILVASAATYAAFTAGGVLLVILQHPYCSASPKLWGFMALGSLVPIALIVGFAILFKGAR